MQIKLITELTDVEIRILAFDAADRGERVESANPFTDGSRGHGNFSADFHERCADLQPAG